MSKTNNITSGSDTMSSLDPVTLTQHLIRCPSVTPREGGALDLLQNQLEALGFKCKRYAFGDKSIPETDRYARVDNLYARLGEASPNFCFAGHTDVVPPGDETSWTHNPFSGTIVDGILHGRGAADMKGGIAAFVGAVAALLETGWLPKGSISLLITGDEEGPAVNGTQKLLEAITKDGETIDHCIVGEPTNPSEMGQMIKNGRRGSLNACITVTGTQGHVAYPDLAENPVPHLMQVLTCLQGRVLDNGNSGFQPSNLEVTTIDVGNPTTNLIPAAATGRINIRFNTEHTGASLKRWILNEVEKARDGFGGTIEADIIISGEAFLTQPSEFTDILQDSIEAATGRRPELSTSGGTSDARFITHYAPVAEFGLIGATIHKVDEHIAVQDIRALSEAYREILKRYFS